MTTGVPYPSVRDSRWRRRAGRAKRWPGILGWREFDGGNGHALIEAADDLLRWMDRVAEIAPSARERSGELVCV